MAAGTLKMMVIIEFRFRNMKMVAARLARKLEEVVFLKLPLHATKRDDSRDEKEDEAVCEYHLR
jgi:hypothetical protein